MRFDSYKWYMDSIIKKGETKYLGINDSKIFIEKVVRNIKNIPINCCRITGNGSLISLDFVCRYILENNISYEKLREMISQQGFPIIKGYPWVSFFSKLNKKQVDVIVEISNKENHITLFKILEELNTKLNNNEEIDSKSFLLRHFVEIAGGKNQIELFEFGKYCNIIFGDQFIFGEKHINELILNLDIMSRARNTDIADYINEKITSIAALLIVLQSINLNPKLKKANSNELCFAKINVDFIFDWFTDNDYFSDEKIDEFIKFLDHLKEHSKEYYLGMDIYNDIMKRARDAFSVVIDYIVEMGKFDFEKLKTIYAFELSDYKMLVYVLINSGIIDIEHNVIIKKEDTNDKQKEKEFMNQFFNKIKDYIINKGYFSEREVMEQFKISREWAIVIGRSLLEQKIIDSSFKVIVPKKISIEKSPEENIDVKEDSISSIEKKLSNFMSKLMDYNRKKKKAMSDQLVISFLIEEYLNEFSEEEINNPNFLEMLKKCVPKFNNYLLEFIIKIHLYENIEKILLNLESIVEPDIILVWLEYVKKYKINLSKIDPSALDDYFGSNDYYKKEKLEEFYSFLYNLKINMDKYEYGDIIYNYFIQKYNVEENFEKIKQGDYNIEHKLNSKKESENNDDKHDDNDMSNGGGVSNSTDKKVQTDSKSSSQTKKIEVLDDEPPVIKMIETSEDKEFKISRRSIPDNPEDKRNVFKTIICGIAGISCAELVGVEEHDILSSAVECAKTFGLLISRNPVLTEIKKILGNNNFIPYFSEIGWKFRETLQPSKNKVYLASRG